MAILSKIRIVVLGFLSLGLCSVFFAWYVLNAAFSNEPVGKIGQTALLAAAFPTLVSNAWEELSDRVTGREAYKYLVVPREVAALDGFEPLPAVDGAATVGLVMRGDTQAAPRGWRVFGGAFDFDGIPQNGLVLVDPDYRVRRTFPLTDAGVDGSRTADRSRRIVHGLAMLEDGSFVVSLDNGRAVQRISMCGERLWAREGLYHHAVSHNADDGTLWVLRTGGFAETQSIAWDPALDAGFVQIDAESGAILTEFSVGALIAANPELGLFDLGRLDSNLTSTNADRMAGRWHPDPFHFNDVDPLPAALAGAYPQFDSGDLLVSARSLNAVFVVDPQTLEVKWHRAGDTLRQHDPDWQADGTISVYDNRMGRGPSAIVAFDPATMARTTRVDGATHDFYSRIRGKHMTAPDGTLLITSPQQGRAFELAPDGAPVMEFYNLGPAEIGQNLALTEFLWLPETALTLKEAPCPST